MKNYLLEWQAANGLVADGIFGRNTANAMMKAFGFDSAIEFGHWFAIMEYESSHFTAGRENMDYSAQRMADVWPTRFALLNAAGKPIKPYRPTENAKKLAHKPIELANFVYGSRNGNRKGTNDGWDYRGGAAPQLTGRDNYLGYFDSVGLPPATDTDIILETAHYFMCGVWFWRKNKIGQYATYANEVCGTMCNKALNLGNAHAKASPVDLDKRLALMRKAFKAMGVA